MMKCSQCHGNGLLQNNQSIEVGAGSNTFTQSKTAPQSICPTCLGTGINTGSGT